MMRALQPKPVARILNRPDPQSTNDAKFSIQYCLARALADRKITIEHFEGNTYKDAGIRDLMSRVRAAPYTTAQFPADNHFGAEVRITLRDGAVRSAKTDQPLGRTSFNPLPPELLKEKFVNCALRVLPESSVTQLHAAIGKFEQINDVRELTALITSHRKSPPRTKALLDQAL